MQKNIKNSTSKSLFYTSRRLQDKKWDAYQITCFEYVFLILEDQLKQLTIVFIISSLK